MGQELFQIWKFKINKILQKNTWNTILRNTHITLLALLLRFCTSRFCNYDYCTCLNNAMSLTVTPYGLCSKSSFKLKFPMNKYHITMVLVYISESHKHALTWRVNRLLVSAKYLRHLYQTRSSIEKLLGITFLDVVCGTNQLTTCSQLPVICLIHQE